MEPPARPDPLRLSPYERPPPPPPMAQTSRTECLSAALLARAADADAGAADDEERDAQFLRRKAAVSELTRARLGALQSRLRALVPALELRLRAAEQGGAAATGGDEVAWTDEPALTAAQMLAKLEFVAEAAARELDDTGDESGDESGDETADAADWSALLAAAMGRDAADGEALALREGDEAARLLDEALDARLEAAAAARREPDGQEGAFAAGDAVARHLRIVLAAPEAERSPRHSLRELLRAFRGAFSTIYEPFLSLPRRRPDPTADAATDASSSDSWALRVACALPLAAADVGRFAGLLTQVLRAKHPRLRRPDRPEADARAAALVRRLVVDALFDALQRTLHELFAAAFRREDSFLGDVAYLSRASAPAAFGVREALRLDGSWVFGDDVDDHNDGDSDSDSEGDALETREQTRERRRRRAALGEYERALFWLDSMSTGSRAPSDKLQRLARACREARGAGALYYVKEWGARCRQRGWDVVPERGAGHEAYPTPDELELSPEDAHALLGFLLSAAPSTNAHAFSQLAVLRIFQPLVAPGDDEQREAVAALSGAVQRMMPAP